MFTYVCDYPQFLFFVDFVKICDFLHVPWIYLCYAVWVLLWFSSVSSCSRSFCVCCVFCDCLHCLHFLLLPHAIDLFVIFFMFFMFCDCPHVLRCLWFVLLFKFIWCSSCYRLNVFCLYCFISACLHFL